MAKPKINRTFTIAHFWALIEKSRPTRHGKLETHGRYLKRRLKDLDDADLAAFSRHFARTFAGLYRWNLWGAGNVMQGGWMGDDGFTRFRNWVILQGREAHDALKKDPQKLLDLDLSPFRTEHIPVSEVDLAAESDIDVAAAATGSRVLNKRRPASKNDRAEADYRLVYDLEFEDLDMLVMDAYERRFKGRDYFEDIYVPSETPTHPNGWERDQANARAYYPQLAKHLGDLNSPIPLRPRVSQKK